MKATEGIIQMINIWNQISKYTFTYELIGRKLYIKNTVSTKAVTELYGMCVIMLTKAVCYIRVEEEDYEVVLEVWDI